MNEQIAAGPAWITPEWPWPPGVHALSTLRHQGAGRGPYASLNLARHVGDYDAAVSTNRRSLRQAAALPDESSTTSATAILTSRSACPSARTTGTRRT